MSFSRRHLLELGFDDGGDYLMENGIIDIEETPLDVQ
jgi:hypothetical protein